MASRSAPLPSSYSATLARSTTAKRRALTAPTTFSAASVTDPASLAKQLADMQRQISDATSLTRAQTSTVLITDQAFAANQSITFQHSLGRAAQWTIKGWRNASSPAAFVESSSSPRTSTSITLVALNAGTADIELS